MFCKNCGSSLQDGAKFCTSCGARVEINEGSFVNADKQIEEIERNLNKSFQSDEEFSDDLRQKQNKKTIISIIILILLILLLLGIFIFLLKNSEGSQFDGLFQQFMGRFNSDSEQIEVDDEETGDITQEAGGDSNNNGEEVEVKEEAVESPISSEQLVADIEVRQVDNSNFPHMTIYASITDENGETLTNVSAEDFKITEIDKNGNVSDATMDEVYQVINHGRSSINLVLDSSSSMDSYNKIGQAKNAAIALVNNMNLGRGDQIEVISFDDYVYLEQSFSSQSDVLTNAINNIDTNGNTALYDGLYAGLYQTYYESGAKCVIGFTDGQENASSYTFDDVVNMAKSTGIPVFIIGIGGSYDAGTLSDLATQCSGKYYTASESNLEEILEDIYLSIYKEQQDYYVINYTSQNESDLGDYREVVVETTEIADFTGYYKKAYIPKTDISGAFSGTYADLDFIIEDSNSRTIAEADLSSLSLAELRIARNEIFARHGRQFKDPLLNQWFYSKAWYLEIGRKYAPDEFDAIRPSPLSKLEQSNATFILAYENEIMQSRDIFPNAAYEELSEYDLALQRAVLKTALDQLSGYNDTAILRENIEKVRNAMNVSDVTY